MWPMGDQPITRPTQQLPGRPSRLVAAAAGVLLGMAGSAQAQTSTPLAGPDAGAPPRQVLIAPYVSGSHTVTDNYSPGSADKSFDAITRVTAGVAVRGRTARLQGFLDASLNQLVYLKHSRSNDLQPNLNSSLQADLLEGRLTLDLGATITRRGVSIFGVGSGASSELANGNLAETRTWRIAPTLRGQLGGSLRYQGQAGLAGTQVSGQSVGNNTTRFASLVVQPLQLSQLSWSASADYVGADYRSGRSTDTSRLYGTLSYGIDALDLRLSGSAGYEQSNVTTASNQSRATWGLGLQWLPSPRTRVVAQLDDRYFGIGRSLQMEHRTALTVWQVSNSRSVNTGTPVGLVGQLGNNFQLLFLQLASAEPDGTRRGARVLDILTRNNIDPNGPIDEGFLAGASTLVDAWNLSTAWRLARDTAVLSFTTSKNRRIDRLAQVIDDLSVTDSITTRGLSLVLTHQLTPESTLGFTGQLNADDAVRGNQSRRQQIASLLWSTRLGPQITTSVGLRHARYDINNINSAENAVTATLEARF